MSWDPEFQARFSGAVREALGDAKAFDTWFTPVRWRSENDEALTAEVPNVYVQDYFERNFRDLLETVVHRTAGRPVRIRFAVAPDGNGGSSAPSAAPAAADPRPLPVAAPPPARDADPAARSGEIPLNTQYTFENFVVGPSNRMAHAAAVAISEAPARAYNPLFVHGAVGLGKTHILQATCHALLGRLPSLRILYLSCEGFVNRYIQGLQRGAVDEFRRDIRSVDVLLVDDIHFLAGKESSQEEIFHTFNDLHNARKQIILSSDSRPEDIPTLEDRLVSRFKWGMVVRLDPPAFETRVAILRGKAELHGHGASIPPAVFEFIATHLDTNVRELEGAIVRLIGYADLEHRPITVDFAKEVLRETINLRPASVTIPDIQQAVCRHFNLKVAELQSRRRTKSISLPRQIAIFMSRKLTHHSLEEIGASFGGKDHATILYSFNRIEDRLARDAQLRGTVDLLTTQVRSA